MSVIIGNARRQKCHEVFHFIIIGLSTIPHNNSIIFFIIYTYLSKVNIEYFDKIAIIVIFWIETYVFLVIFAIFTTQRSLF